jgi:co-chaperonin GroES (HSP10)|uniref:Co-chaperonin GroES n=2 Tax=uncultured virus TaxID=340016 RepID=A0A221S2F7_9VIRU|nr:co-chaperonin GroES [uncultured virus]
MMMSEAVAEIQLTQEDIENQLPVPVGYRVLVALPQVEETYGDSGLVKSATTINHEHVMSIIGLVLDMGQQAYADEDRFPTGPWCKQGDYVMFRANTGTRFKVNGVEYRLMNDDSIEAVVADPRGITRA